MRVLEGHYTSVPGAFLTFLFLDFNTALSTAAKRLTFKVGSSSFRFPDGAFQDSDKTVLWTNVGPSWMINDTVSLSLVEPADTAPGKPTGLSASASGETQIDLSWTAPSDNGGEAISGYRVEVSSDGGTTWSDLAADTGSTTTTYAHTGLSAGTARHYRVSAINSVGTGAASDTASATTATLAGKPTGLSASRNGGTRIDLSWTAPSVTGSGAISGYRVEVSSDGGTNFSDLEDDTESTSTTYSHTGLSASTTRHYRVSAITSVGTGAASGTASATTAADATLPTITSVAVTGSEVTLAFSEALDTASRPPSSVFTLTAASGGVTRTTSGKTTRIQLYGTSAAVSLVASASKGEVLTLSYTAPASNPLQDTAGNDMASFSGMSAQNASANYPAPGALLRGHGALFNRRGPRGRGDGGHGDGDRRRRRYADLHAGERGRQRLVQHRERHGRHHGQERGAARPRGEGEPCHHRPGERRPGPRRQPRRDRRHPGGDGDQRGGAARGAERGWW